MPPMEFDVLVERLIPQDEELWQVIQQLLARKKSGEELDYEPQLTAINDYLEEQFQVLDKVAASLNAKENNRDHQLDALFREALQEVRGRAL